MIPFQGFPEALFTYYGIIALSVLSFSSLLLGMLTYLHEYRKFKKSNNLIFDPYGSNILALFVSIFAICTVALIIGLVRSFTGF